MKKILFVLLVVICFGVRAQVKDNLITRTSFDKIQKNTSLQQLKKLYGNNNVVDDIEYGAEGMDSFTVTKIFRDTRKEMVVMWAENKMYKTVAAVYASADKSPYQTADGLKVGSTLDALVKVNGKRINFSGTGWDYGGAILSFNKGKLEKSGLFFDLTSADNTPNSLIGDVQLHTDMPLVKKHIRKFTVRRISVDF